MNSQQKNSFSTKGLKFMPKRKTKTLNRKVKPRKESVIKKTQKIDPKPTLPAVHPWRMCPYGEHWVKTHPEGSVTTRHEHCARNPSGKDQLYPRWLFEKRRLLSSHLKKPATWLETIWDYKAVARAKTKKKAEEIKTKFNNLYEELQKCEKI